MICRNNTTPEPGHKAILLHFAACMDDTDTIAQLINRGLDVNAKDCHGQTPLHLAVLFNNSRVIATLLNHHADIYAIQSAQHPLTPLHLAAIQHCQKRDIFYVLIEASLFSMGNKMLKLLDKNENRLGNAEREGRRILLNTLAALYTNQHQVRASLAIDKSSFYTIARATHLELAWIAQRRRKKLRALQEKQKFIRDINKTLHNGLTALECAIHAANIGLIHKLIKRGADINTPQADKSNTFHNWMRDTPLHYAIRQKNSSPAVLALLQYHPNIHAQNRFKETPLYTAVDTVYCAHNKKAHADKLVIIEHLLKANADIYAMARGTTPLHLAAKSLRFSCNFYSSSANVSRQLFALMINAALRDLGEKMTAIINQDEKTLHYPEHVERKIILNTLAALHTNQHHVRTSLTTDNTTLYRSAYAAHGLLRPKHTEHATNSTDTVCSFSRPNELK